jgi:hypothetical protein
VAIALVHALKLGLCFKSKMIIGSIMLPFFLGQLLEYHCGLVRTHIGNMGVTEGQIGQILVMFGASFLGADVFQIKINVLIPPLASIIPDYFILEHFIFAITVVNSLLFAAVLLYEMIGKQKSISGKLYTLWGTNPIIIAILNIFLLDQSDQFTNQNASLLVFGLSMVFALITTKVIISSMAHMHFGSLQPEVFIFWPYFYLHYFYNGENKGDYEFYALIGGIVLISALYLRLVRVSILQITGHLGIYCFSIKKPVKNE